MVVHIGSAVRDAGGCTAAPGAVALRSEGDSARVIAAGPIEPVRQAAGPGAILADHSGKLLLPGLVNAHTHLELTGVGYQPYSGNFIDWIKLVRSHWPNPADPLDPANGDYLQHAAAEGAQLSRAAGVLTVGDLTRHHPVYRAVAEAGLRGVSYVELFGLGPPHDQPALQRIQTLPSERTIGRLRLGLEPHAPYSAGPGVYQAAAQSGSPVATHLAETPDELRFVACGDGPHRDLLIEMGKWRDDFAHAYAADRTPVQWMQPYLAMRPWNLAHCNYIGDADLALLAEHRASVVYCPRAGDYFGHRNHRYRDMLAAGINVALGTDSIICHGTLSVLDEMRYLHQRDATDPDTLLKMATVNGMIALRMNPEDATFAPGASPGLIAVACDDDATDALEQVLQTKSASEIEVLENV